MNLCDKLKARLENYFSMPFDVKSSNVDGETHYVCNPSNEGEIYFEATVYIRNSIRLIVEIYPQKHGGYILNDMAMASQEKQKCFFDYMQMLIDKGAKVLFMVNDNNLSVEKPWPKTWKSFKAKITKVPIPENNGGDFGILTEWLQHGIDLIFSLLTISDVEASEIAEIPVQTEGTPQEIRSIRYERNPINRQLCLHKKGYTCVVCGMNFQDIYGEIGKNFIEVHHTTPVSEMGTNYVLDIERDLVPLCSNCHSMVHRKKPPFSIGELKTIFEEQNNGGYGLVAEPAPAYRKTEVANLIVGVVKSDNVTPFRNNTASTYYFGKRFPSKYNLKDMRYFAPYFDGGVRGYYEINAIRTARKSEILGDSIEGDNDIRIVLDLGDYFPLRSSPIKLKLANYNHQCLALSDLINRSHPKES